MTLPKSAMVEPTPANGSVKTMFVIQRLLDDKFLARNRVNERWTDQLKEASQFSLPSGAAGVLGSLGFRQAEGECIVRRIVIDHVLDTAWTYVPGPKRQGVQ